MNLIKHINSIVSATHPSYKEAAFKDLTKEEFDNLLDLEFSDMKKAVSNGNIIYRGIGKNIESDHFMLTPSKRISENTTNIYTRLFSDILPSWSEYPKRNESFICTTYSEAAEDYGEVFIVYPLNGAKIGICPREDIWFSFYRYANINILDAFNRNLLLIILYLNHYEEKLDYNPNPFSNEYKELVDQFIYSSNTDLINMFKETNKKMTKFKKNFPERIENERIFRNEDNGIYQFKVFEMFKNIVNSENILKYLDNLLSPKNNNFKLTNTTAIASRKRLNFFKKELEVWVSGPCLFERD